MRVEWIRDGAIHQPQHSVSQPTEGAMCWLHLKTGGPRLEALIEGEHVQQGPGEAAQLACKHPAETH
jgi:hypothetical protein